eukprot:c11187_g1_i1.p1 GENE.c11187_g1_i1~~c11187_g1_i1.p1  ORF type:complete len:366 (-),score=73.83 c11187_g1_i1:64-1161(-)
MLAVVSHSNLEGDAGNAILMMQALVMSLGRLHRHIELRWRPKLRRLIEEKEMKIISQLGENRRTSDDGGSVEADAAAALENATKGKLRKLRDSLRGLTPRGSNAPSLDQLAYVISNNERAKKMRKIPLCGVPLHLFNELLQRFHKHDDDVLPPFQDSSWNTLWAMLQADQALLQWITGCEIPLRDINLAWHHQPPFIKTCVLFHYKNQLLNSLRIPQKYVGHVNVTVTRGEDLDTLYNKKEVSYSFRVQLGQCSCSSEQVCAHRMLSTSRPLSSPVWDEPFDFVFPAFPSSSNVITFELMRSERLRRDVSVGVHEIRLDHLPAEAIQRQWIRFGKKARVRVDVVFDYSMVPIMPGMSVCLYGATF